MKLKKIVGKKLKAIRLKSDMTIQISGSTVQSLLKYDIQG